MAGTIQHASIPDAQRHEPKGASTATSGQALFSTGSGATTFRSIDWSDVGGTPTFSAVAELVITSYDNSSQTTNVKEVPVQITFGAALAGDGVDLDADGTVTFNDIGTFIVIIDLFAGKTSGSGHTKMFLKQEFAGATFGPIQTVRFRSDDNGAINKVTLFSIVEVTSSPQTYKVSFATDTNNTLGFQAHTLPAITGWSETTSPSKILSVYRFGE